MSKKTPELVIYEELERGPIYGIDLVRRFDLSPPKVFETLKEWEGNGWVVKCDPPPDVKGGESHVWYNITLAGQSGIPKKLHGQG